MSNEKYQIPNTKNIKTCIKYYTYEYFVYFQYKIIHRVVI